MISRYEKDPEVALRLYGEEIEAKMPEFHRLKHECKNGGLKRLKNLEKFNELDTVFTYTLSTFLWFRDRLKEIEVHGEKRPMSIYIYYVDAVKSLGDVVGIFEKIENSLLKLMLASIRPLVKKKLDEYHEVHTIYSKKYRNFLTHQYFGCFIVEDVADTPLFKVPHFNIMDFEKFPGNNVIINSRQRIGMIEELDDLFKNVSKGVDLRSKLILDEIIKKNNLPSPSETTS